MINFLDSLVSKVKSYPRCKWILGGVIAALGVILAFVVEYNVNKAAKDKAALEIKKKQFQDLTTVVSITEDKDAAATRQAQAVQLQQEIAQTETELNERTASLDAQRAIIEKAKTWKDLENA